MTEVGVSEFSPTASGGAFRPAGAGTFPGKPGIGTRSATAPASSVPAPSATTPGVEKLRDAAPGCTPFSSMVYAVTAAYSSSLSDPGSLSGIVLRGTCQHH